jgi:hypothetical protein
MISEVAAPVAETPAVAETAPVSTTETKFEATKKGEVCGTVYVISVSANPRPSPTPALPRWLDDYLLDSSLSSLPSTRRGTELLPPRRKSPSRRPKQSRTKHQSSMSPLLPSHSRWRRYVLPTYPQAQYLANDQTKSMAPPAAAIVSTAA